MLIYKKFFTLGEEIFNAVTHGVGAALAIAATVLMLIRSASVGAMAVVSCAIYGASLIILYTMSTLYHALSARTAKAVMRIFDHCTIFVLIAGTYTPLLPGSPGRCLGLEHLRCYLGLDCSWNHPKRHQLREIQGLLYDLLYRHGLVCFDGCGKSDLRLGILGYRVPADRRHRLYRRHRLLCKQKEILPFCMAFLRPCGKHPAFLLRLFLRALDCCLRAFLFKEWPLSRSYRQIQKNMVFFFYLLNLLATWFDYISETGFVNTEIRR